jgi:hypothetical protein
MKISSEKRREFNPEAEDKSKGEFLVEDLMGMNDQECRFMLSEGNMRSGYGARFISGNQSSSKTGQVSLHLEPWIQSSQGIFMSEAYMHMKPLKKPNAFIMRKGSNWTNPIKPPDVAQTKLSNFLNQKPQTEFRPQIFSQRDSLFRLTALNFTSDSMQADKDSQVDDSLKATIVTGKRRSFIFSHRDPAKASLIQNKTMENKVFSGFTVVPPKISKSKYLKNTNGFQTLNELKLNVVDKKDQRNHQFVHNILGKERSQERYSKLNKNPYFLGAMRRMLSNSTKNANLRSDSWKNVEMQRGILVVQKKTKGSDLFRKNTLLEKQIDIKYATKNLNWKKSPLIIS